MKTEKEIEEKINELKIERSHCRNRFQITQRKDEQQLLSDKIHELNKRLQDLEWVIR